jgi:thiamine-phosphate pyrophosphorylase
VADARGKLARLASRLNEGELPPLVLMTDDDRLPDPCGAAHRLPQGSLIVLRAKTRRHREELAGALARIARTQRLFLSIADDPELAARLGADGVHFPETRAGALFGWRARRPEWFVTVSAHSLHAAARAQTLGADAVFLSPVFATKSHPERRALTPLRLRLMTHQLRVPLYALGGIDADTIRQLGGAKLAGVAAIGALAV